MSGLARFVKFLHWLEDAVLVALFLVLVGLAFSQISLRNFFHGGWPWADPALRVLVLWLAMWGASLAARHGHHIRIELAPHYLPLRWRRYNMVLCDAACAVITGIIAYASVQFILEEYQHGGRAFAAVPVWVCESIIPFSLSLLTLRFAAQAFATALRVEDKLD
jgi:TRAP-type C4-dicarboxylate transport system permease small subunit